MSCLRSGGCGDGRQSEVSEIWGLLCLLISSCPPEVQRLRPETYGFGAGFTKTASSIGALIFTSANFSVVTAFQVA